MKQIVIWLLLAVIAGVLPGCTVDEDISEVPPPVLRLDYVEIKEQQGGAIFYLYGEFPNQNSTSKIFYNASDGYLIRRWSKFFIEVFVSEILTNRYGGEISVGIDGRQSNKRKISAWKGNLVYTYPDNGTLMEKIEFDVILRADIDPHRATTQPLLHPLTSFVSNAKVRYTIGGHGESFYKEEGAPCFTRQTVDWGQATGELQWRSQDSSVIQNQGTFNAILEFQENVGFKIKDLNVWKLKAGTTQARFYPQSPCNWPASAGPVLDYNLVDIPNALFKTPVNNFYDVFIELEGTNIKQGIKTSPSYSRSGLIYNPPAPDYTITLQWAAMQKLN